MHGELNVGINELSDIDEELGNNMKSFNDFGKHTKAAAAVCIV